MAESKKAVGMNPPSTAHAPEIKRRCMVGHKKSDRPKKTNSKSKSPAMVVQQPGQQAVRRAGKGGPVYMAAPQLIPGIPRGLEYLASVSSIAVHQLVEMLEVFTGIETRNRYSLCNQLGQQVYFAYEESSLAGRMCCGRKRSFTMHIMDNLMQPIMLIHRPFNCCVAPVCGYLCSYDECVVECPPGNLIGRVKQQSSCCNLEYMVQDMEGNNKLFIKGPVCHCCSDTDYEVFMASNMAPIGAITKKWGGIMKEMLTDADSFIVNFPVNLDVHLKASLLAATFLIDFIMYEDSKKS